MSEVAVGYVSLVPKFGSGFKSAIAGQIGQAGTAGGTTAGNSFKSTFLGVLAGNVMTSAIRGIGSTIKGAFGGGFDRLMNIEQAEIKLRTLGINVDAAMASVGDAVDGTKFAISDAADMAAFLGASGVAAGQDMTKWLSRTADAAQFTNRPFGEMQQLIGEVVASGKITGETLNRLPLAAAALADKLGVSQAEVRKLASEGKISAEEFGAAMDAKIGGAAKNAGASFLSLRDNVKTALNATMAALIEPFTKAAMPIMTAGLALVKGFRDSVAKPLGASLSEFLQPKAEALAASMEKIPAFFAGIKSIFTEGDFTGGFGLEGDSPLVGGLFRIRTILVEITGGIRAFGAAWTAFDGDITSAGFPGFMERLAFVARTVFTEITGGLRAFVASWQAFDGDVTSAGFPGFMERLAFILRTVFTEITGGLRAFVASWQAFDGDVTSSGFPGFMERLAFVARTVFTEITGGVRAFVAAWQAADGDVTSSGFPGFMERLANTVRSAFTGAKDAVLGFVEGFGGVEPLLESVKGLLPLVTGPLGILGAALREVLGDTLREVLGDGSVDMRAFGENIGQTLRPLIDTVAAVAEVLIGSLAEGFAAIMPVALEVGKAVAPLIAQLVQELAPIIGQLATDLIPPLVGIITELAPVITDAVQSIAPLVSNLIEALAPALSSIIEAIGGLLEIITPFLIPALELIAAVLVGAVEGAIQGVTIFLNGLRDVIDGVVKFVTAIFNGEWGEAWEALKQIVWGIIQAVAGAIWTWLNVTVVGAIRGGVVRILTSWRGGWKSVLDFFKNFGANVSGFASNTMNAVVNFFRNGLSGAGSAVSGGLNSVRTFFANAMTGIRNAVSSGVQRVLDFFRDLPGKILSTIGNMGNLLKNSGKALLGGFISGISDGFSRAKNAISDGLSGIRNFFPFSPAKTGPFSGSGYTTHSGRKLMQDFAAGIEAEQDAANRALQDALTVTPTIDGAQVGTSTSATGSSVLGGTTVAGPLVHVAQMIVRSEDDIRKLSQELQRLIDAKLRALGKSTAGGIA